MHSSWCDKVNKEPEIWVLLLTISHLHLHLFTPRHIMSSAASAPSTNTPAASDAPVAAKEIQVQDPKGEEEGDEEEYETDDDEDDEDEGPGLAFLIQVSPLRYYSRPLQWLLLALERGFPASFLFFFSFVPFHWRRTDPRSGCIRVNHVLELLVRMRMMKTRTRRMMKMMRSLLWAPTMKTITRLKRESQTMSRQVMSREEQIRSRMNKKRGNPESEERSTSNCDRGVWTVLFCHTRNAG